MSTNDFIRPLSQKGKKRKNIQIKENNQENLLLLIADEPFTHFIQKNLN